MSCGFSLSLCAKYLYINKLYVYEYGEFTTHRIYIYFETEWLFIAHSTLDTRCTARNTRSNCTALNRRWECVKKQ